MKKLLLIMFLASAVMGAERVWSSTSSTGMDLATNYSGSGSILDTDTLIFNGTSVVNATATKAISVQRIRVEDDYSGSLSFGVYNIILVSNDGSAPVFSVSRDNIQLNTSSTFVLRTTVDNSNIISLPSSYTWTGGTNNLINSYNTTGNITIGVQAITKTSSLTINTRQAGAATFNINGNISVDNTLMMGVGGAGGHSTVNTNGHTLTTSVLDIESQQLGARATFNAGASSIIMSTFKGTTTNGDSTYFYWSKSNRTVSGETYTLGSKQRVVTDSGSITFTNNCTATTYGQKFHKVIVGAGKKLTFASGSSGSLTGIGSFYDTLISSVGGVQDTLYLTSRHTESCLYIKDQHVTGDSLIVYGVDGGNNSGNIRFTGFDLFIGHSMITIWNSILSPGYYYELSYGYRNFVDKGVSGAHISEIDARTDSCLTAYNPTRFFMWVGQNDLNTDDSAVFDIAMESYFTHWRSIINKVKNYDIDSIYIVDMSPIGTPTVPMNAMRVRNYMRFNKNLKDSCIINRLYLIQVFDSLLEPGTVDVLKLSTTADGIHPNSTMAGSEYCAYLFSLAQSPPAITLGTDTLKLVITATGYDSLRWFNNGVATDSTGLTYTILATPEWYASKQVYYVIAYNIGGSTKSGEWVFSASSTGSRRSGYRQINMGQGMH